MKLSSLSNVPVIEIWPTAFIFVSALTNPRVTVFACHCHSTVNSVNRQGLEPGSISSVTEPLPLTGQTISHYRVQRHAGGCRLRMADT